MTPSILWLLSGAAFLAVEAFGAPGIGFLFVGLGAILTGLFIELDVLAHQAVVMQFAAFFINSSLLAVLLWKKVKQFRAAPGKAGEYHNIIGDDATTVGALTHGHKGEVRWSGTLMRAELEAGHDTVPDGTDVIITAINGNVLTVRVK